MSKFHRLGATGKYPLGKLNPEDEGELTLGFSIEDGNVRLDFGKLVSWMAFPPNLARTFAAKLVEMAERAEKGLS